MTAATDPVVLFDELPAADGKRFGLATLNAPASLHALSLDMIDLLYPQLLASQREPAVVGVVLRGSAASACRRVRAAGAQSRHNQRAGAGPCAGRGTGCGAGQCMRRGVSTWVQCTACTRAARVIKLHARPRCAHPPAAPHWAR